MREFCKTIFFFFPSRAALIRKIRYEERVVSWKENFNGRGDGTGPKMVGIEERDKTGMACPGMFLEFAW